MTQQFPMNGILICIKLQFELILLLLEKQHTFDFFSSESNNVKRNFLIIVAAQQKKNTSFEAQLKYRSHRMIYNQQLNQREYFSGRHKYIDVTILF